MADLDLIRMTYESMTKMRSKDLKMNIVEQLEEMANSTLDKLATMCVHADALFTYEMNASISLWERWINKLFIYNNRKLSLS